MNHFPFFAPVSQNVINAITNLNKANFAGAMPFIYFHEHNGQKTIGTEASYKYTNKGLFDRFPPLITNLEVKPTGTMGVVREGSVTVKFSSMGQMKRYQNFFRIGSAKTIVWGWNQNRLDGSDIGEINITDGFSKPFVGNIDYWQKWIKDHSLSADVMVGPLINFNFTINNDASVDVVFTVGCPTEITAYLGSHKQNSKSIKTGDKDNVSSYRVANLLGMSDSDYDALLNSEIRPNLINYDYSQSSLSKTWTSILSSIGLQYDSISEDVYISFKLIAKYAINQRSTGGISGRYKLNLDDSITCAHPNMISNSENVIFLNDKMANPSVKGKETILDLINTQAFTAKYVPSKCYPEPEPLNKTFKNESGGTYNNQFDARRWGKTENVFFKVTFVQDIIKNNADGNIVNILEQLCSEINIASCGLTDVAPQTTSGENGKEVFTIVDYALTPKKNLIPLLPLFEKIDKSSTITNISFNCDLPKEIGAMAMLGNRKTVDSGGKLFFSYLADKVLDAPGPSDYEMLSGETGGKPEKTPDGRKIIYAKIKPGSQKPGELDKFDKTPIPNVPGLPGKDRVWSYEYGNPDNPQAKGQWYSQEDESLTAKGQAQAKVDAEVAMDVLINESCVLISNEPNEHTNGVNNTGVTKAIFKNTDLIKSMYFGGDGINKKNPLLPIELEITILGLSGVTAGQVLRIDNLPFDNNGIFQVKEVNHTVNDLWETTIKLGFRPDN
jgi:hypothetical protein